MVDSDGLQLTWTGGLLHVEGDGVGCVGGGGKHGPQKTVPVTGIVLITNPPPALVPDAGVYVIPVVSNVTNTSQRIRVWRYNEVAIAGGLIGSRMRVEVRQTLEPFIVQ